MTKKRDFCLWVVIWFGIRSFNSLAPGEIWIKFQILNFPDNFSDWWLRLWTCEVALRWMSLDLTDDKLTFVQAMAWCRQATIHYVSQFWPKSLSPHSVTRPQWVNLFPLSHQATSICQGKSTKPWKTDEIWEYISKKFESKFQNVVCNHGALVLGLHVSRRKHRRHMMVISLQIFTFLSLFWIRVQSRYAY